MHQWKLERPLAFLDIEATGIMPRSDRIIDLAIVKILPGGQRSVHKFRVHPGIPIPAESTRIHGISDADVAACPSFAAVAGQVAEALDGCDLAGYNLIRFDVPLLAEEFIRANIQFSLEGRRIVDVQRIFHKREPRDLSAALSYYCGEMHFDAHGAEADALATLRVLEGQFDRYPDLPRDIGELDQYCNPRAPDWVDSAGKLRWVNGEIVLNFSRKKGETLRNLIATDKGFVKWMLRGDFPRDLQDIVRKAMEGDWPAPPQHMEASS